MPIAGSNSIDAPGVLLSMTHLQERSLNADKSTVSIGSGLRWADVYNFLQPYGLVVVGGRAGQIGVPGLFLGGGLSFYSAQYGFASDNVVNFEVSRIQHVHVCARLIIVVRACRRLNC